MGYRAIIPALIALVVLVAASQDKPKAIKDVMAAHKGAKDSMLTKIIEGKATDDDVKKLVVLYEGLVTFKPPMGDEKSWKEKSEALLAAAKEVSEKKAGAVDKLKKASDCKACHSVHKGK